MDKPWKTGGPSGLVAICQTPKVEKLAVENVVELLAKYDDVRGIRIEDVVLVTEDGYENLSKELPTSSDEITKLIGTACVASV